MNCAETNRELLKDLHAAASGGWANIPLSKDQAKLACKMEAALKLVLIFHSASPWNSTKEIDWCNLQVDCGCEEPVREATTRVLCDTIREVLGRQ